VSPFFSTSTWCETQGSDCILLSYIFQYADYANDEDAAEHGYVKMPPLKKMFRIFLSQ
ncbi:hypothetical protein M9458_018449, partial [Cirrhinus mrigala]